MPNDPTNRLPPYSAEIEAALLGTVMDDPAAMEAAADRITGPDAFYDIRHRTVWETCLALFRFGQPIDAIQVASNLRLSGELDSVGGMAGIAALAGTGSMAFMPDKVEAAIESLLGFWQLRRVLQVCTEATDGVFDGVESVGTFMDRFESRALSIRIQKRSELSGIEPVVDAAMQAMESRATGQDTSGIGTGFTDLDRITGGLFPGEMTVVAARPSIGKTSIAINIAEHVCVDLGLPAGVFSLEMPAVKIVERLICSRGRVDSSRLRPGRYTESDITRLGTAAASIRTAPLWLVDAPVTISQLRSMARSMKSGKDIRLLVIDYLQLIPIEGRTDNLASAVGLLSTGIKLLARELSVPVILISQLNRDCERDARAPKLVDLRQSGSIEQDADGVWLMHRDDDKNESNEVKLIVAKNRNGPRGIIGLTWLPEFTRFANRSQIDMSD